jgi:hypothetical protein
LRDERHAERNAAVLGLILAVELFAFAALKLPTIGRLELFLFRDWGSNLTVQDLLDRGLIPIRDFHYPYGLLPLAVGRAWFGTFGLTPWAYLAAVAACHLLVAWGLARAVLALRAGLLGAVLMVAALPLAIPPTYPNLCHGLEASCLIHGLAELANGRKARALALATICLFDKASMAYVLGAVLVTLIVHDHVRSGRMRPAELARSFAPAAVVGAVLAATLAGWLGVRTLVRSLLPLSAPGYYEAARFGFFFGRGRSFLLPPDVSLAHYLGTQRTYWMAASLFLSAGALASVVRPGRRHGRVILACAIMHVAFVCLFYGNEAYWIFYAYLLAIGVTALMTWGGAWRGCGVAVLLLALASDRSLPREFLNGWREVGLHPAAWGLWTTPRQAASWREVLRQIKGRRPVILCHSGCATVLYRDFAPAVALYLAQGMDLTPDMCRQAEQIREGSVVVVPTGASQADEMYDYLTGVPLIREAHSGYRLTWADPYFEIYERPASVTLTGPEAPAP